MKFSNILNDSRELLQIGMEKLIETPKPSIAVYSYTFMGGLSSVMGWIVGVLPNLCMLAGFIGTIILAHANWKKAQREGIETETAKMQQRIVREQMRAMSIETREEDKNETH